MKAGALDFLAKPFTEQDLMEAINRALAHDRASQIDREERMSLRQRLSGLTPRERDVLELVVAGFRNKQAAAQLRIGEGTLQIHRCRVMRKMRAKSFADLVRMAGKLPLLAQPGSVFPMDTMRAGCDHAQ
jgi:FixJ family two-component response regulator